MACDKCGKNEAFRRNDIGESPVLCTECWWNAIMKKAWPDDMEDTHETNPRT